MAEKHIVIGDESDDGLLEAVRNVIKDMGAKEISSERVVVGSQDIQILRVLLQDQVIVVEAETYIGITVAGEQELVDEIVQRVRRANRVH